MQRDAIEGDVREGDGLAFAGDLFEVGEGVEGVVWEVYFDGSFVFCEDGGDEDGRAEEELVVDGVGVLVAGVGEPEGGGGGGDAGAVVVPEGGVEVVEEAVAQGDGPAGGGGGLVPAVEFLRDGGVAVVVAEEGHEGAEGGPARAEGLGGVAAEAADVGADERDLVDGGEAEHGGDRHAVVLPE